MAFAVTYIWVDAYLGTIDQLEGMKLDRIFSCHWANRTDNAAVTRWLRDARDYALLAERVILEIVKASGERGVTLSEMCVRVKPGMGMWDAKYDGYAAGAICGHLQRLRDRGWVRVEASPLPVRYVYEKDWHGIA